MSAVTSSPPKPALPGWVMPLAKTLGVMAAIAAVITLLVQSGAAPRGSMLYNVLADPFISMWDMPDLFAQTIWEGLVAGVLYALIALGFVLIFKASGVFNFAQGIMVVFAALSLVGSYEIMTQRLGMPTGTVVAILALIIAIGVMFVLAWLVERIVLRPLVNQHEIIMLMATVGLTYFLIGFGEYVFGGNPKVMITRELGLPTGQTQLNILGGRVNIQHLDVAAAVIASVMIACLAFFFQYTRIGRALRAVADSHKAALSVGISLNQIWVIVWFTAGVVALVTGIMWGARSDVSFALEIIALKALPVLILGGFTSVPGAIVGGLIIGIGEKLGEFYWGPLFGGGIETWLAYIIALGFLLFRPQGLFEASEDASSRHRDEYYSPFAIRHSPRRRSLTDVLPRDRPVQDRLRLGHGDLPDPAGPDRHRRDPRRRAHPALRGVGFRAEDDPAALPGADRRGDRAEHPHRLHRADQPRLRRLHGGRRLRLLQADDDLPRGEHHRLDLRLRLLLGGGRRVLRSAQLAHQGALPRGRDARRAVLPAMGLRAHPLALQLQPVGAIEVPLRTLFGVPITGPTASMEVKYLICLGFVVLMTWAASNLVHGRIGRSWMAVRDMDIAAELMGIRLLNAKLMAFAVSSFYCGVSGALFVFMYLGGAEAGTEFAIRLSFLILFAVIIGGAGSMIGSFLGSGFIVALPTILKFGLPAIGIAITGATAEKVVFMIIGALTIYLLIVEPHGLARLWQIMKQKLRVWPFPY